VRRALITDANVYNEFSRHRRPTRQHVRPYHLVLLFIDSDVLGLYDIFRIDKRQHIRRNNSLNNLMVICQVRPRLKVF